MPGCCAIGCTNSDKKGFLMKVFPRNPARRALWAAKVKRKNWKPTNSTSLCEVHFEADQWEKPRVDGKRILKFSAVPSIFTFFANKPKLQSVPTSSETNASFSTMNNNDSETSNILDKELKSSPEVTPCNSSIQTLELKLETNASCSSINSNDSEASIISDEEFKSSPEVTSCSTCSSMQNALHNLELKLKKYEIIFQKSQQSRHLFKCKLRSARNRIKQLQSKLDK